MKTTKIIIQADNSHNEETLIAIRKGGLLKSVLVIFMLAGLMLLSSCLIWDPFSRHGRGGYYEGHGGHGGHEEFHGDHHEGEHGGEHGDRH